MALYSKNVVSLVTAHACLKLPIAHNWFGLIQVGQAVEIT